MNVRRLGPVGRTTILSGMGLALALSMVVAVVLSLRIADSAARELAGKAAPAQSALSDTSAATSKGQELLLVALQSADPAERAIGITTAQAEGQRQNAAWNAYLKHALHLPGERAVQQSYATAASRSVELAASLLGTNPADPAFATGLADERNEARQLAAALATLQSKYYNPIVRDDAAVIVSGIDRARTTEYLAYGVLAALFTAVALWLRGGARRDRDRFTSEAAELRTAAEHADLETSLQRALEMEPTEEASYSVIAQALTIVSPNFPAELLLADSSHSHFRQVLSTAPDANAACPVGAPGLCPATISGQTQAFADNSSLGTCPFLRERGDSVWAICIPVSIAGHTTGVIHTQGPVHRPPDDNTRALELVGRKTGEHLGMLRAFSRSETQAQTDPLTNLLNRRSLEARVHDLDDTGLSFVVVYGDLDQFKILNDVHGHDTGDRALRLFAQVLRDTVRPTDIPARYGGEEFVIVLPDCKVDDALTVVERIRAHLRTALVNASVPPFTASFGIAASEPGRTFSQTLDAADQALLHAKRTGRDRIIVSGAEPGDSEPVDNARDLSPDSAHS